MSKVWFFASLSVLNFTALILGVLTQNSVIDTLVAIVHVASIVTFAVIIPKTLIVLLTKDEKYFSKISQLLSEMEEDNFVEFRKKKIIFGKGKHPEFPKRKFYGFEFYTMEYDAHPHAHRHVLAVRLPNRKFYAVRHDCKTNNYRFIISPVFLQTDAYHLGQTLAPGLSLEEAKFMKALGGGRAVSGVMYSIDENGIRQLYTAYKEKLFTLAEFHDLYFHPKDFQENTKNNDYKGVPLVFLKASLNFPAEFPGE